MKLKLGALLMFSQAAQAAISVTPEWSPALVGVPPVSVNGEKQFIPAPPPVSYPGPVNKNEPTPAKQSYYTRPLRGTDLR